MEVIVRNIQREITQYYKEKIGKVKAGAPIVWGDFAKLFGWIGKDFLVEQLWETVLFPGVWLPLLIKSCNSPVISILVVMRFVNVAQKTGENWLYTRPAALPRKMLTVKYYTCQKYCNKVLLFINVPPSSHGKNLASSHRPFLVEGSGPLWSVCSLGRTKSKISPKIKSKIFLS